MSRKTPVVCRPRHRFHCAVTSDGIATIQGSHRRSGQKWVHILNVAFFLGSIMGLSVVAWGGWDVTSFITFFRSAIIYVLVWCFISPYLPEFVRNYTKHWCWRRLIRKSESSSPKTIPLSAPCRHLVTMAGMVPVWCWSFWSYVDSLIAPRLGVLGVATYAVKPHFAFVCSATGLIAASGQLVVKCWKTANLTMPSNRGIWSAVF
jgi:hypothetical protein